MVMAGDVVMARGKRWLPTFILFLAGAGVGDFFLGQISAGMVFPALL